MTKERLKQLKYIEKALESIRKDIKDLNRRIEQSKGRVYMDKAKGSMADFPYIERHYNIIGIDDSAYYKLRERLEKKERELQEKLAELEAWLEGIEDERLYLIFRLKYRNGLNWKQIGEELGYHRTRVSQLHDEYLRLSE